MTARYDLYLNPPSEEGKEERPLHARIVPYGTISTQRLAEEIAYGTSFTPGDVVGVLEMLALKTADYLSQGYWVNLNGLGIFSISLKCRPVFRKDEIRSASVHFKQVNFRAGSELRKRMSGIVLERNPIPPVPSSGINMEEANRLLDDYFTSNPFISRTDFSRLSGLPPTAALKVLNHLIGAGQLRRYGVGRTVVYLRPAKFDTQPPSPGVI